MWTVIKCVQISLLFFYLDAPTRVNDPIILLLQDKLNNHHIKATRSKRMFTKLLIYQHDGFKFQKRGGSFRSGLEQRVFNS